MLLIARASERLGERLQEQVQPGWYRFLGQKYWILSLASLLAGLLLAVASESLEGFWKAVLAGLSSGLVALGIVTWASEYVLKTDMTRELINFSRLDESIYNTGITEITEEKNVSWGHSLSGFSSIVAVSVRPSDFVGRIWPHILENAGNRQSDVEIMFVDPESAAAAYVAECRGNTAEGYRDEIKKASRQVEESWIREKGKRNWPSGSTLTIQLIKRAPVHSQIYVPGKNFLILDPLIPSSGSQSTLAATFREMRGARFPDHWMESALSDARAYAGTPAYTDKRRTQPPASEGS